jgi:adenosylcobinamide-phosphate synthase
VDLTTLHPRADLLAVAIALDFFLGDPVYRWHPIRLIGATLSWFENRLRAIGADGRVGGCFLFLALATLWAGGIALLVLAVHRLHPWTATALHLFLLYSMIALGDLLKHGREVDRTASRGDLTAARVAIGKLVGRDAERMDEWACRRAAIESLSENLVDGFVSPIFWYLLLGLPGIVLFKVVSTMDSMVGYKTPRYLKFGWCGARLDDLMNLLPARLTWLLMALVAIFVPGASARKTLTVGWRQHHVVPGPNAGWSEAAIAGALQRRLIGPIWSKGKLVTELWLGELIDPPAGLADDYRRAEIIVCLTAATFATASILILVAPR